MIPDTTPTPYATAAAAAAAVKAGAVAGREDGAGFRLLMPEATRVQVEAAMHAALAARRAGLVGTAGPDLHVYCEAFRVGAGIAQA